MKSRWKTYLLYSSLIVIGGLFIFLTYETYKADNMGFETKTYWDWMELLIIPIIIGFGAIYLRQLREIERDRTNAIENAQRSREILIDSQQEAALQSYLNEMQELLLQANLLTTQNDEVRSIARARTLVALGRLDLKRKVFLITTFLYEANLIRTHGDNTDPPVKLAGAELSGINLEKAQLEGADLENTNLENALLKFANLRHTNLLGANLNRANLQGAQMQSAYLPMTSFQGANLRAANLTNANLEGVDLSGANLEDTILENANLTGAFIFPDNLKGAILIGANLKDAIVSEDLLKQTALKGATMPDGTKHE